jgi:hypothetical protein
MRLLPLLVMVASAGIVVVAAVVIGLATSVLHIGAGAGADAGCPVVGQPASGQGSDLPPANLMPIYRAAASDPRFPLGSDGWAYLAAINRIETDYGRNLAVSSAGAIGWMQFMPGSFAMYRIDYDNPADPTQANPYDPYDAIYSAANMLYHSGAPGNWQNAIFAYNHAQWYVDDVTAYARQDLGMCSSVPPGPLVTSAYADPFRDAPHTVPSRIDMGVDYSDASPEPIEAIGTGVVTLAGWEGGGFGTAINYTLADPPLAGRYVYVAEGITLNPNLKAGDTVTAGETLGWFVPGQGIEIGFAANPGRYNTLAAMDHQQSTQGDAGANLTYCGQMMSDLIAQLGGQAGLPEGRTAVGNGCAPASGTSAGG